MCTRVWPPGLGVPLTCPDYAGPNADELAAAGQYALPYPGACQYSLSTTMQLRLASAPSIETSGVVNATVQQAIATAIRAFTVIDNVQASVRIWSPGASGASGYVYIVNIIFPTAIQGRVVVDGTPCPRVLRVDIPQVIEQCPAFASELDTLLNTGGAANVAVLQQANNILQPYDTVLEATFTPLRCPVCRT